MSFALDTRPHAAWFRPPRGLQVTLKASQGGITEANISVSTDPSSLGEVCATGVMIDETSSPVAVTCLGFGRYLTVSTDLQLNLCR